MNAIKPEFTSQVMSNTTGGILPYQQTLIDKMQSGGFKPGELMVFAAGRQTGKSMLNQIYEYGSMTVKIRRPMFVIHTKAEVDGATWYTISCTKEVSAWLRSQPKELHYAALAHGRSFPQFDIHEKLYSMMALKWS